MLLIMIRRGSELWWFSCGTEGSFTKWQICLRCGPPTKLHRYLAFMWTFCCINVAYILIIVLLLLVFAIALVCCIQPNYEGSVLCHPRNSFTPCHYPSMVDLYSHYLQCLCKLFQYSLDHCLYFWRFLYFYSCHASDW